MGNGIRGEKLILSKWSRKSKNISLLMAITKNGPLVYMFFLRSVKGIDFFSLLMPLFEEHQLSNKKYFFVLDNAKTPKKRSIIDKLDLCFLPSYSPYLNLVENYFYMVKKKVNQSFIKTSLI